MSSIVSHITSITIKALRHWPLWGDILRWPVNSPHKGPVTRKMFPFDDIIMHPIHRLGYELLCVSQYPRTIPIWQSIANHCHILTCVYNSYVITYSIWYFHLKAGGRLEMSFDEITWCHSVQLKNYAHSFQFDVLLYWLILSIFIRVTSQARGNHAIAPLPVMQAFRIWINTAV